MRLISHPRRSYVGFLFVLVASCGLGACASASEVDQDGAVDGMADTGATTGTPSPITDFNFTSSIHCDPPIGCDRTYTASRNGALTYKEGYEIFRTAALGDTDLTRLIHYFDDPASVTALTSAPRCSYGVADASYQVELVLENGTNVVRDINGCKGPQYDVINGWVATIAGYFP